MYLMSLAALSPLVQVYRHCSLPIKKNYNNNLRKMSKTKLQKSKIILIKNK